MSKTESSALTGLADGGAGAALLAQHHQALRVLRTEGFCVYGSYPWDFWEKRARAAGVEESLAGLGRALMREADQHAWCARLQSLCGWRDEGRRMIALALRAPETARRRWEWLMETDGLRVDPATFDWLGEDWWEWPRRRREWLKQRHAHSTSSGQAEAQS